MSNYTVTTNFASKDSLPSGSDGKIIRGSEFTTEFTNISTAISSKADLNNPQFTGTVVIPALTFTGTLTTGTINGGTY